MPEEVVSASSVSAFISRLNSMHLSFLMFCFSAVCFFINVSFRAVVSAFWAFLSSRHSSALYCFFTVLYLLMNKIFIHSFLNTTQSLQRSFSSWAKLALTDKRLVCEVTACHTTLHRTIGLTGSIGTIDSNDRQRTVGGVAYWLAEFVA